MTPCIRGEIRHAVKSVFQSESRNIYDIVQTTIKTGVVNVYIIRKKRATVKCTKKVAVIIVSQFIRPFNNNNE